MGTQARHVHVASLLQRGKDRPVHPQAVRQVLHDKGLGSVRSANSPAEANGYSQTARSTFKTAAPRFKPVSGIFILPSGQLPIPVVYEQIAFFWNFRHRSRGVRTNSTNSCGTALPGCFLKFGKNCDKMEFAPLKVFLPSTKVAQLFAGKAWKCFRCPLLARSTIQHSRLRFLRALSFSTGCQLMWLFPRHPDGGGAYSSQQGGNLMTQALAGPNGGGHWRSVRRRSDRSLPRRARRQGGCR